DRYFNIESFLDKCIDMLGGKIRSCHIKDVHLKEEYTFQLEECAPGRGEFPLLYYMKKIDELDKDMPIILEHLSTDEDYIKYMEYLQSL
ncbi:MAG: sugar phosphate isomerase/epimerase, partial [Lachnospiraceae bacterium]|nr:sugar phosphate isomerase/epimerase [Lachnospiraceae bacterium]